MAKTTAIRFGGQATSTGYLFELSGGALPLDFANTLDERPRGGVERLTDYRSLIQWYEQADVVTSEQALRLFNLASSQPDVASKVHIEALTLRELIFATVEAMQGSSALDNGQMAQWNDWLNRIQARRRLTFGQGKLEWQAIDPCDRLDSALLIVAEAAMDLLLDPDQHSKLRMCAAANCDWVFLDKSRRQNKVWCDMTVCGNRAKAARHYHRKAGKEPGDAA